MTMMTVSHVISFRLLKSNHMTSKLVEGRPEMTARDGYEMKEWNCLLNQIFAETIWELLCTHTCTNS